MLELTVPSLGYERQEPSGDSAWAEPRGLCVDTVPLPRTVLRPRDGVGIQPI